MPKIGLISNPGSQRNRRGLQEIRQVLAGNPDIVHVTTEARGELDEVLADFARRGVDLLLINGGDGTVQTVLTRLLEKRPFETPPYLAILPRGMANTTAADVGLRGNSRCRPEPSDRRQQGRRHRRSRRRTPRSAHREPCRRERRNAA